MEEFKIEMNAFVNSLHHTGVYIFALFVVSAWDLFLLSSFLWGLRRALPSPIILYFSDYSHYI
jgi:hypothetical protein